MPHVKNHRLYKYAYQNCFDLMARHTPNPREFDAADVSSTAKACRRRLDVLPRLLLDLTKARPWWSPKRFLSKALELQGAYLSMLTAEAARLALTEGNSMDELRALTQRLPQVSGSRRERELAGRDVLASYSNFASGVDAYERALNVLALVHPVVDVSDANEFGGLLNPQSAQDIRISVVANVGATALTLLVMFALRYGAIWLLTTLVSTLLSKAVLAWTLQQVSKRITASAGLHAKQAVGRAAAIALVWWKA